MQLKDLQSKIAHFNLNLDYPIENIPIDIQTNALINKVLNNFYNIYKDNIQQYSIVYEYRDDCISFVGLQLLQILAEQMNFSFDIYGKVKKFKKKVGKNRRINDREVNKKTNVLLISSFNPIYKVNFKEDLSKKINFTNKYNIVEQFTPDELSIAFNFYGGKIEEISNDDPVRSIETLRFNKWIKKPQCTALPPILISPLNITDKTKINMVALSGDAKIDEKTLQQVEQSDFINIYYMEKKKGLVFDKNYAAAVKNKSNVPSDNYLNINKNFGEVIEYITPVYFGEWQGRTVETYKEDN